MTPFEMLIYFLAGYGAFHVFKDLYICCKS